MKIGVNKYALKEKMTKYRRKLCGLTKSELDEEWRKVCRVYDEVKELKEKHGKR